MPGDHHGTEAAVRDRLQELLAPVEFPVHDPLEVAAAVERPHSTTVTVGDRTFTAMSLAVELEAHQAFPYRDADALVDDVVQALRDEDLL